MPKIDLPKSSELAKSQLYFCFLRALLILLINYYIILNV